MNVDISRENSPALMPALSPKRTFTREVPIHLSFEESQAYGKRLARKKVERDAIDEKRKNVMAQFKGQLAEVNSEIDRLASAIDTGEELRVVECGEFFEGSQKVIRRLDTMEEVDRAPLDWSDRQAEMFPGGEDDHPTSSDSQQEETEFIPPHLVRSSTGDFVAVMADDGGELPVEDSSPFSHGKAGKPRGKKL